MRLHSSHLSISNKRYKSNSNKSHTVMSSILFLFIGKY